MIGRALLFFAAIAPLASAQFQLVVLKGNLELPVPPVYDMGHVDPGVAAIAQFRVRNTSNSPTSLYTITLAGTGFTIPSPPALPLALGPQQAVDFTVQFKADTVASYSAGLTLTGISVVLTSSILPSLTYRIPDPVDFGSVDRSSTAILHFSIENRTAQSLTVPPVLVRGQGFSMSGSSPAGTAIDPQQALAFDLAFAPPGTGTFEGSLAIGDRTFALTAVGADPPEPKPVLSIDLPQAGSARQGTVRVMLDAPARAAVSGSIVMDFHQASPGPADSTVAFASGASRIPFTVAPGDTVAISEAFQTGTTAGTLTFTAAIGETIAQSTIPIAAATVAINSATASRGPGTVTIQLSGYDNTRSAGQLFFTFYDRSGNAVGSIPATADFKTYFLNSDLGGLFALKAVFPVTGDTTQIGAFEVQLTNSAGTTITARTAF